VSARAAMTVQERLLDDVATLRTATAELKARQDQADREIARMKRGGAGLERRYISLEEANLVGILPRHPRTIREWMRTPESRAASKVDLFVRRVAGRIEVDLNGLERWRAAMAAPTAPEWPKRFGRRPS
jgi:hypothetical protein